MAAPRCPAVAPRHHRVCLIVLSSLCLLAASLGPALASEPPIPVPPGTKRTAAPAISMGPGSGVFTLVCAQSPAQSYALMEAALLRAGWTVHIRRSPAASGVWMLTATLEHPDGDRTASIQGKDRGSKPGSALFATLTGRGIGVSAFDSLPVEAAPSKPSTGIPPGVVRPGLTRPPPDGTPRATPANAFQEAIDGLDKPLGRLIDALIAWCTSPTNANRAAALGAADRYIPVTNRLQVQSLVWVERLGTSSAASRVLSESARLDAELGTIVLAIEKATPATVPTIRREALPRLKRLKEDEVPKYLLANRRSRDLVEVAKQEPEKQPVVDTPVPAELLAQTEEPPYTPSTVLRVSRFWTPTKRYWEAVLPNTWIALRCWNAGCPEGCEPVDDEGKLFSCKAFGTHKTPIDDPSKPHCLNIERSPHNEKQYLSHPLTLFGLVSLAVEVGDPRQLEAGGQVEFRVDGEELFSIGLDAAKRPSRGSNSPYGVMDELHVNPGGAANPYNRWSDGIAFAFGDEAARNFKNACRSPYAVLESAGGEFDGYVLFTPVGQAAGEAMARYDVMMPPAAGVDPVSLALRLMAIAEKRHPALENSHTITVQATVGGVRSQPVEIHVPAVFGGLADSAGAFSGWPGDEPEKWTFGAELGALAEPEAPARIDVDPNAATKLYEDTKKLALVYTYIIVAKWLEKLEDYVFDLALENIAQPWASAKAQGLLDRVNSTRGMKIVDGAMKHFISMLPNDQVVTGLGKFTEGYAKKTLKYAGYGIVKKQTGLDFKATAKTLAKQWEDHADVTVTGLTPSSHMAVCAHRRMIKVIAEAQLAVQQTIGDPVKTAKLVGALTKCIFGPPGAVVEKGIKGLCYTADASVAYSDLNAIREIWHRVELVKQIVENPRCWLKLN